ncbi:acetyl-CoA carboxylase biotin carboxyl carrier protein subunit [Chelatococcus sp. HY11]|uniref:acetyl-CoA carboxylase biotin carboxyl carrier protein subunit n=1 Tax=Chelatococcus sp. TaxID=1953771 RepID=UPI001BCEE868|nr:acetyl-CoA carboxylase biotin carboxyl carrier protein subunit [Chelatococcus sp. HY11]MBX3547112.1 acetyl-CoA carboxylase biotin carboxyl carrier protein subunit [Chelatococcus sp.]
MVPIDATVVRIEVAIGDSVEADTDLAAVEAIRMEMPISAGVAGRVTMVHAQVGDTLRAGTLICTIEPHG